MINNQLGIVEKQFSSPQIVKTRTVNVLNGADGETTTLVEEPCNCPKRTPIPFYIALGLVTYLTYKLLKSK